MLSGLDASTTNRISAQLFGKDGHFRKSDISVILATHSRRFACQSPFVPLLMISGRILPFMDSVVVLEGGRLTNCGPCREIQGEESYVFGPEEAVLKPETQSVDERRDTGEDSDSETLRGSSSPGTITAQQFSLQRQTGNWSVYKYYSRTAGRWVLIIWALFTISEAVFANFARELNLLYIQASSI